MIKPEIAIRADGSSAIGMGHIHRMLALAGYLQSNYSVNFYCYNADKLVVDLITQSGFKYEAINTSDYNDTPQFLGLLNGDEIIVLDGYNFKTEYQKSLKEAGHRLIAIDDLNEWQNVADIIINHGFSGSKYDYKIQKPSKLYTGLKYAIIKEEILNSSRKEGSIKCDKVLICIGGTDVLNYSEKIILSLLNHTSKQISIVTYPLNKRYDAIKDLAAEHSKRVKLYSSLSTTELIELIRENDFAILQPSNIALEAAAIGIGLSLIQTAENQKFILNTLVKNACAIEVNLDTLVELTEKLDAQSINAQIKNQHSLIDRKSPHRLLEIVNELAVRAKRIAPEDAKLIYDWNNDPVTRANSYNQSSIQYNDHVKWFEQKVSDPSCFFEVFSLGEEAAGCVRIESKNEENIIGITIAPSMRGKRLAIPILNKACSNYFEQYGNNPITAYIKKGNTASLKSFKNAGFNIVNEDYFFGELSYKLIKHSNE